MRTIAITGASGFIGRRVVEIALGSGWRVRALCRDVSKFSSVRREGLEVRAWSLDSETDHTAGLAGVDAVCHAAALVPTNLQDVSLASECFEANAAGTARLLDSAVKTGVASFVYLSTVGGPTCA